MVVTVHLADLGLRSALGTLRARPRTGGLRYAEVAVTAPLAGALLPAPQFGRVALIAAWDDDRAVDRFLSADPLARRLAGGWHVRLAPLRTFGAWPELPDLPRHEPDADADEPVAVLTLGRLKLHRIRAFLLANRPAADHAIGDPAMLAGTALARPPRLVATFSLWRRPEPMRRYVTDAACGHRDAVRAHQARAFHRHSAFIRFRPYAAEGRWDGVEPLGAAG